MKRRDRLTAALLFSVAGVPAWLGLATSLGGLSAWHIVLAALGGAAASGVVGALAGPTLGAEARSGSALSKGAILGVFVTAAGVALGAVLFVVYEGGVYEGSASRSLPAAAVGVVAASLVVTFPWLAFGAAAGALFYWLRRAPAQASS